MTMAEPTTVPVEPTYRLDKSFEWNAQNGPHFSGNFPVLPPSAPKDFFGHAVNSRFGLAASLGVSANWIDLYGRLGFDILTYKTVRKYKRLAHPWPNFFFLREGGGLDPDVVQVVADKEPADPLHAASAGSVGMPSTDPEFWQQDIRKSRARLGPGQVLIVSIVATSQPDMSADAFVAEFEELAASVREAGADIVEANLSCPNVDKSEGEVYQNARLSGRIAAAVRRGAKGLPILVKTGEFRDARALANFLGAIDGYASGVVMINGLSRAIATEAGADAFGPARRRAGVVGTAIFDIALANVRNAVTIIADKRLDLKVVAVGSASSPERVRAFLDAGACAALAAWPAAMNPYLASQVRKADPAI
jgi:dihydroorotate dehydrogenase